MLRNVVRSATGCKKRDQKSRPTIEGLVSHSATVQSIRDDDGSKLGNILSFCHLNPIQISEGFSEMKISFVPINEAKMIIAEKKPHTKNTNTYL